MNKSVILFPDATAMSEFIMSRQLSGAEVNTKELTVIAPMEDDDVIEAINDYKGRLNQEWLSSPKLKC